MVSIFINHGHNNSIWFCNYAGVVILRSTVWTRRDFGVLLHNVIGFGLFCSLLDNFLEWLPKTSKTVAGD